MASPSWSNLTAVYCSFQLSSLPAGVHENSTCTDVRLGRYIV